MNRSADIPVGLAGLALPGLKARDVIARAGSPGWRKQKSFPACRAGTCRAYGARLCAKHQPQRGPHGVARLRLFDPAGTRSVAASGPALENQRAQRI
jgi:hypothetical protein